MGKMHIHYRPPVCPHQICVEMKHNTIHVLHLTQLTSQNTSLTTVSANLERMEITQLIKN